MASKAEYSRLDTIAEVESQEMTDRSSHATYGARTGIWRNLVLPWAAHLLIFTMYATVMLLPKPSGLCPTTSGTHVHESGASRTNLLADDRRPIFDDIPIEYQELVFQEGGSPYSGRPNARTERLWQEMLSVGVISISEEEYGRFLGLTAPDVQDPSRYAVGLDVFHQLHCLNGLRNQVFNPRHRPQNDLVNGWELHMDHCIEFLRQTIMCQAATTPTSMYWNVDTQSYSVQHGMPRMCRSFDAIWEWASDRNTTGITL